MNILLAYDICVEDGGKTLNKVRKICKNYGKSVQRSLFEFDISYLEFEKLKSEVLNVINIKTDSIIFYNIKNELFSLENKENTIGFDDILIF